MRHLRTFFGVVAGLILGLVFVAPVHAATLTYSQSANLLTTPSASPTKLFDGKFTGGASVAVADVNGDGQVEYIVGAQAGGGPMVQIFTHDGGLLTSWFAFPKTFSGGINVAAGDLDGDGIAEIVVTPASNHASVVEIFDLTGKLKKSFAVFDATYTNGLSVATFASHLGKAGNIVVGTQGGPADEVRTYSTAGKQLDSWKPPFSSVLDPGLSVATSWSTSLNAQVIVAGAGAYVRPIVMVYNAKTHKAIASWQAFGGDTPGVRVSAVDGNVVVAPMGVVANDIRTYTLAGKLISTTRVFASTFRGGAFVAAYLDGALQIAVTPSTVVHPDSVVSGKVIRVSLSKQELSMYQNGKLVSTRRISTGKWSTPTPIGTFHTQNKMTVAYSAPYKLYMEYWMAFTPDGSYGLHALPFWKLKGGGKLYEGAAHIGTPVSHGCIRQTVAEAKTLYDWTPIGTPVIITK